MLLNVTKLLSYAHEKEKPTVIIGILSIKNPGRSSRGDSVELRLQSVMVADVWWRRSRISIG